MAGKASFRRPICCSFATGGAQNRAGLATLQWNLRACATPLASRRLCSPTVAGLGMKARLLTGMASLTLLDMSGGVAVAQQPYSWTGFYFGWHAGYSWGTTDSAQATEVRIPAAASGPDNALLFLLNRHTDPQGPLGGFQVGYNQQINSVVFGWEVDFSFTNQEGTSWFSGRRFNVGNFGEDYIYQETLRAKLEYMGTARGRFGYAYGPFLPFVTGGFAWGQLDLNLNWSFLELLSGTTPGVRSSFNGSQSEILFGWTAGGGFEYALGNGWSARAEYFYIDLGDKTFFAGNRGADFGLQDHIVRVGLNFKP